MNGWMDGWMGRRGEGMVVLVINKISPIQFHLVLRIAFSLIQVIKIRIYVLFKGFYFKTSTILKYS